MQAFQCEENATSGDIVVSPEVLNLTESFLDDYGARTNRTYNYFTEVVASVRGISLAGLSLEHLGRRIEAYGVVQALDAKDAQEALADLTFARAFVQSTLCDLLSELKSEAGSLSLAPPQKGFSQDSFDEVKRVLTDLESQYAGFITGGPHPQMDTELRVPTFSAPPRHSYRSHTLVPTRAVNYPTNNRRYRAAIQQVLRDVVHSLLDFPQVRDALVRQVVAHYGGQAESSTQTEDVTGEEIDDETALLPGGALDLADFRRAAARAGHRLSPLAAAAAFDGLGGASRGRVLPLRRPSSPFSSASPLQGTMRGASR